MSSSTRSKARPPVGASFKEAFEALLGQLFSHQYPGHPEFDTEIKPGVIRKIWPEMQRAIEAPDRRGLVPDSATRRLVRSVVFPCQLGQMGETHLLVQDHWRARFAQSHARDGGGAMTVAKLRQWIDIPSPMGLPLELQNLIILSFAAMTNRRFILRGGPVEPGDRRAVPGGEREAEQVEVLADPGRGRGFRDRDVTGLEVPAQHHLGRRAAEAPGDPGDDGIVQHLRLAERAPGLRDDAEPGMGRA